MSIRRSLLWVLSVAALLLLPACQSNNPPPPPNPPGPHVGQWIDDGGVPITGTQFSFPTQQSGQYAGYFYTQLPAVPQVGQTLTLTYDVIGNNPQWVQLPASGGNSETDINPPTLHLFLWRRADTGTCQGVYADYRLFAGRTALVLGSGQTISVPLDAAHWTGCYGAPPANMQAELSDLLGAGFTFGGQWFAGHAIQLSGGSAQFYIRGFYVN